MYANSRTLSLLLILVLLLSACGPVVEDSGAPSDDPGISEGQPGDKEPTSPPSSEEDPGTIDEDPSTDEEPTTDEESPPTDGEPDEQPPPDQSGGKQVDCFLKRELAGVEAGPPDALVPIDDDEEHGLPAGSVVRTDDIGEATLKVKGCDLTIYLYQQGELMRSACSRSEAASGNITCALAGTAAFNNKCAEQVVIETNTARLELTGTWVSITYMPERQLSLAMVFDGLAEAEAVVDPESGVETTPTTVGSGHFWFTDPETEPVAGLEPRVPHPFENLPAVIEELGLDPWMERLQASAAQDNMAFPDMSTEAPVSEEPTPAPEAPPLPDLTVSEVVPLDAGAIDSEGNVVMRVLTTITNQGAADAGPFKVGMEYTSDGVPFTVPFAVDGEAGTYYPFLDEGLTSGNSIKLEGTVTFPSGLQGTEVPLYAVADSCQGDEGMSETCREEESDETNNAPPGPVVTLPLAETPP
jgi:hypothetical protein